MDKKLVVICGPTASGKTDLSIYLAKKFNGTIISADSRQIYQEMDIGTAKLSKTKITKLKSQNGIIHYMIDVVKPNQEFNVADYQKKVLKILDKIWQNGKNPFLVGGTGLYIKSITDGLLIPKVAPNKKLRAKLESKKNNELFERLKSLDQNTASIIDKNNHRRLIRAIEVCLLTKSEFPEQKERKKINFEVLQIGIDIPRPELYSRIDKRVDEMIKGGLVDETRKLLKKYDKDLPSMSGIGYKEIIRYLNKEISLEKSSELIKYRTHGLVRRQLTWFRKDKRIKWIRNQRQAEKLIQSFFKLLYN